MCVRVFLAFPFLHRHSVSPRSVLIHVYVCVCICVYGYLHAYVCVFVRVCASSACPASPFLQYTATHCNTLQHTAIHCNTLQHTATHYKTLQLTATHVCVHHQHVQHLLFCNIHIYIRKLKAFTTHCTNTQNSPLQHTARTHRNHLYNTLHEHTEHTARTHRTQGL